MIPAPVVDRITSYGTGAEWRADAQYGAPLYAISGTTTAAIMGQGTSTLPGPWAVFLRAQEWDGERAGEEWAAMEAAGEVDDGITWEPYVLGWAAKKWGYNLEEVAGSAPFRIVHPSHPWLRVSPDGLARDDRGRFGILDSKVVYGFSEWGEDGSEAPRASARALDLFPPDRGSKYLMQAYTSLSACPAASWFDFIICIHPRDTRRIRIWRDEGYQRGLVERIAAWRQRHLVEGHEPEPDISAEHFRHAGRREREDRREATPEEVAMLRAYRDAGAEEKAAKTRRAEAKRDLYVSMEDAKTLTVGAEGKPATFTIGKRGPTARRLEEIG